MFRVVDKQKTSSIFKIRRGGFYYLLSNSLMTVGNLTYSQEKTEISKILDITVCSQLYNPAATLDEKMK